MTTEALKSATITNRDATPPVINDGRLEKGVLKSAIGSVTTTTGKTTGSTHTLVQVPSKAFIRNILLSCGAHSTSAAVDVGVYRTTADGGAAVDADFFASAVDISSALSKSNITNESLTYTLTKQEQPLWQASGLTTDPGGMLDIVCTTTATDTAGALLGIEVQYCDNGS